VEVLEVSDISPHDMMDAASAGVVAAEMKTAKTISSTGGQWLVGLDLAAGSPAAAVTRAGI
jgi:hypothetical protein